MDKDTRRHDFFQKAVALLALPIVTLLISSKLMHDDRWTQEQSNVLLPWIHPWEEATQFCLSVFFFAICAIPSILRLKAKPERSSPSPLIVLQRCALDARSSRGLRAQRIIRVLALSILNDLWIGINIRGLCYAASDLGCVFTGAQSQACRVARSVQFLSIFAGCLMILEIHFSCKASRPAKEPVKEPVKAENSEADTGNIHPASRQPVVPE
ncbi:hypothetical protein BGZ92_003426 [Podila epicladia]|nr:hypothetical protein BGZ92_003426 [Podila epicladia]